jgi:thiamine kinase-like enzyme
MVFVNIHRKINARKVLEHAWVKRFFQNRAKKYFPGAKLLDVEIELVRNFRGKFRNLAIKYLLTVILGGGKKTKLIRARIDTLHNNPDRQYQFLKYLYSRGFKNTIARPLEYMPSLNMLLYEDLPGTPFQSLLEEHKNLQSLLQLTPQIASWLKRFHRLKITSPKQFISRDIKIEKEDRRHWLFLMRKCAPEFYRPTKEILDDCWKIRKKSDAFIKPKDFSLVHGDFHWGNIISKANRKIGVLDFSDSLLADPLEDVARFVTQTWSMFRYYAPRRKSLGQKIIEKFLKCYFKNGPNFGELTRFYYFATNSLVQMAAIQALVETHEPAKQKSIKILLKEAKNKLKKI